MPFWLLFSLLMSHFFALRLHGEVSFCITNFCAYVWMKIAIHLSCYRFKSTKILHSMLHNQIYCAFKLYHTLLPFDPLLATLIFSARTYKTFLKRNVHGDHVHQKIKFQLFWAKNTYFFSFSRLKRIRFSSLWSKNLTVFQPFQKLICLRI